MLSLVKELGWVGSGPTGLVKVEHQSERAQMQRCICVAFQRAHGAMKNESPIGETMSSWNTVLQALMHQRGFWLDAAAGVVPCVSHCASQKRVLSGGILMHNRSTQMLPSMHTASSLHAYGHVHIARISTVAMQCMHDCSLHAAKCAYAAWQQIGPCNVDAMWSCACSKDAG
eukprot:1148931-Pelagomonas_calceolata.AAC.1